MQIMYCRYCRKDVPMLDEVEFARVTEVHSTCIEAVKHYRREQNATLSETPLDNLYAPVQRLIEEITGTNEFHYEEVIRRHRISRWQKDTQESAR